MFGLNVKMYTKKDLMSQLLTEYV